MRDLLVRTLHFLWRSIHRLFHQFLHHGQKDKRIVLLRLLNNTIQRYSAVFGLAAPGSQPYLGIDGEEEGLHVGQVAHVVQHVLQQAGQRDHGVGAAALHGPAHQVVGLLGPGPAPPPSAPAPHGVAGHPQNHGAALQLVSLLKILNKTRFECPGTF